MRLRLFAITLAWLAVGQPAGHALAGLQPPQTGRIVAVGDIHGSIDGLRQILRAARIIDDGGRWIGGKTHLIQTGDFTDRGARVRDVMDLLMRLEGEARRSGGRVDVLFGNHEGMNVLHDFRDVSQEAYATFADKRSEDRRRRAFENHAAIARRAGNPIDRDAWMSAHPPGYVEYAEAMGPRGSYGRWIRSRKAVLQVDDIIFMHAGVSPENPSSPDEVNRAVEREVRGWDDLVSALTQARLADPAFTLQEVVNAAQSEIGRISLALKEGTSPGEHVTQQYVSLLQQLPQLPKGVLISADGPLWYRGLAQLPETATPAIEQLLSRIKARRFVIGHTVQLPGRITPRFGGRVIVIDTGILTTHYTGGQPSALEIEGGKFSAVYVGSREELFPAAARTRGAE